MRVNTYSVKLQWTSLKGKAGRRVLMLQAQVMTGRRGGLGKILRGAGNRLYSWLLCGQDGLRCLKREGHLGDA